MANEYLKRQPTSTGNRKVFTWSGWVKTTKESKSGNGNDIFFCASSNNTGSTVYHRTRIGKFVQDPHDFGFNHYDGANDNYASEADFRDFSSWSHYLCSVDTTKEQTTDRVKIYVNGAHINDLQTVTAINQNLDTFVNGLTVHYLGADGWNTTPQTVAKISMFDVFMVDGQALTPDVFGFYKDGDGYISVGSTQATDFRPGQWSPHSPRKIKTEIERRGGFGVNGFYLPMNDSSNPGADFHTTPNSIITLKGEDLPQPRNGAPTTSDAYVSELRQETGTLGFDGVVKFDGSGDYLSIPTSSDFAFGTGDFTVEFFTYLVSTQDCHFYEARATQNSRRPLIRCQSGTVRYYNDGADRITGPTLNAGQWYHIAVSRSSGVSRLFVNGTSVGTYNDSIDILAPTTNLVIASNEGGTNRYVDGYISNLRVVKGTAVYTTNFTVPTEPLTNVTNTKLLCCNSSTSATAATVTPGTITANGNAFATRNELTGSIVLACPFVAGGFGQNGAVSSTIPGLGDYHISLGGPSSVSAVNFLAGSGSQAVISGSNGIYYGSSLDVTSSSIRPRATVGTSFKLDGDYTVEFWAYINSFAAAGSHLVQYDSDSGQTGWAFSADSGNARFLLRNNSNQDYNIQVNGIVPAGQWNHFAGVYESDKNRSTLYLNGVAIGTADVASNYLSIQYTNLNRLHIGSNVGDGSRPMQGYIQDLRIYKGVAKYKGGFDVLKPYTPVGIESWRTVSDTCKNNFPTLNPLFPYSTDGVSYSDGNLFAQSSSNDKVVQANMAFTSGKWYWETRNYKDEMIGIGVAGGNIAHYPGVNTNALSYHFGGSVYDSGTNTGYGAGWSGQVYHVIGIAVDKDNDKVYWHVDGVWANSANPVSGTGGWSILSQNALKTAGVHVAPSWRVRSSNGSEQVSANFGQNPTFSGTVTAGTFTDSNGKGLFKYAPPTGFLALCEDNLPTPAIADPGKHFKSVLWTGSGGSKAITGVGFKPDLVWIKDRDIANYHNIHDSVRPANLRLSTNVADAENNGSAGGAVPQLGSFDNDGFSLPTGNVNTNGSGDKYVAWCWKAGGAAVSNTDGTITSQVSANQTAGFSIVSYTGTGTNATVGHGLNKTPKFIITKNRDASVNWIIYHGSVGATQYLRFTTNAATTQSSIFNDTEPTSSVFSLGSSTTPNGNGQKQIAYCWAEIEGFSKFGSYVANASTNGPCVYCGFKPALVLVKNISTSGTNWELIDNVRSSTNGNNGYLIPNDSGIEYYTEAMDLLSNGFKIRTTSSGWNSASGNTYIFAAFAESPFQTANAK